MRIVRLQKKHGPSALALAGQLGYAFSPEEFLSRLLALELAAGHCLLGAEENDKLVGWLHGCLQGALLTERLAFVEGLVVEEAARGKGAGKLLLQSFEEWAKAEGAKRVRVGTNVTRKAAHRFYEREGYSLAKSWHLFEKALD